MRVYEWKGGYHAPKIKAQVVGEHLDRIKEQRGSLTADIVLADAKRKRSPIHKVFDWNDTTAAHKFRLGEAGRLIRCINITHVDDHAVDGIVRAFVYVSSEADEYVNVVDAMSDPVMRAEVIERAKREVMAWGARYEHLRKFSKLIAGILDLID